MGAGRVWRLSLVTVQGRGRLQTPCPTLRPGSGLSWALRRGSERGLAQQPLLPESGALAHRCHSEAIEAASDEEVTGDRE